MINKFDKIAVFFMALAFFAGSIDLHNGSTPADRGNTALAMLIMSAGCVAGSIINKDNKKDD